MDIFQLIKKGKLSNIKQWLAAGNDVNSTHSDGWSLLYTACYYNQVSIVQCLLKQNADIHVYTKGQRDYPVHAAAGKGFIQVLRSLVSHQSNLNVQNALGETPLWLVCYHGNLACVKLLLHEGAAVNQADNDHTTPLSTATQNNHIDVVRYLLQQTADVNKSNKNQATPLHIACKNGNGDLVRCLLDWGAGVNKTNTQQLTPLMIANQANYTDIVKLLLKYGSSANTTSTLITAPLYISCLNGNLDTARELISKGADLESRHHSGSTALIIATMKNHKSVVELLLKAGADINATTARSKSTALHKATEAGSLSVVKCLLARHPLILKDSSDNDPLDIAREKGFEDILVELRTYTDASQDYSIEKFKFQKDIQTKPCEISALGASVDPDSEVVTIDSSLEKKFKLLKDEHVDYESLQAVAYGITAVGASGAPQNEVLTRDNQVADVKNDLQMEGSIIPKDLPGIERQLNKILDSCENEESQQNSAEAVPLVSEFYNATVPAGSNSNVPSEAISVSTHHLRPHVSSLLGVSEEELKNMLKGIVNLGKEIQKEETKTEVDSPVVKDFSHNHLLKIAMRLGDDWKILAGLLGVSFDAIQDIDNKHGKQNSYAAWNMLIQWSEDMTGRNLDCAVKLKQTTKEMDRIDLWDLL